MTVTEYNACVDNFADNIFRFVVKTIKDQHRAKDIVQDTFSILWEKHRDVCYEKAKSYLFTTAYRNTIDILKREKKINYQDELNGDTLDQAPPMSDLKEQLELALCRLPSQQQSVVRLRDYEGYSYQEIQKITGLTEAQVKVYIYRARKSLKNYIGIIDNIL